MSYQANAVNLSSGQIQFRDPTKPWDPTDLPHLPSTNLSITAIGRIEDGDVSTLYLTNAIQYADYEPLELRSTLVKSLQITHGGVVQYREPTIGFASTVLVPFSQTVSTFGATSLGAPGIGDVHTTPDTITNAVAKLDGWITNAFLQQPPAVTPVESETNSIFSGVRWENFKSYNIFDKTVPYVYSLLLIVGDPAGTDYLSLELMDAKYFPYKTYTDGISPNNYPVVRVRIFTDFFFTQASAIYSKQILPYNNIRVLTESGYGTLPQTGKVLAIENTDGEETYTTVSLYMPNLVHAYPKDSEIPIKIAFLNRTEGAVQVAYCSTMQTTVGGPSDVQSIAAAGVTPSTFALDVVRPEFSDELHGLSTAYFSTYRVDYSAEQFTSAHQDAIGFRYGIPDVTTFPADVIEYSNAVYYQNVIYAEPLQRLAIVGEEDARIIPGMVWSTSVTAYNLGRIEGTSVAGPYMSTLFPPNTQPRISSVVIENQSPTVRLAGTLRRPTYSAGGWSLNTSSIYDTLYMSNAGTPLHYRLSTATQFNDASFPGDRSTITFLASYTDANTNTTSLSLELNTVDDDFELSTAVQVTLNTHEVSSILSDTYTYSPQQHYFYKAYVGGKFTVSTFSTEPQSISLALTNSNIPGYTDTIEEQSYSTNYAFITEPYNAAGIENIVYTTSTFAVTQISGLYTPSNDATFYFDIYGSNFANLWANSNVAIGELVLGATTISPAQAYSTNIHLFDGESEITTLPIPQDTVLCISSCSVGIDNDIYQDPNDPQVFMMRATLVPANPIDALPTYTSTLAPSLFIDTVSQNYLSQFDDPTGSNGLRVVSWLPRIEDPGTIYNMNDGVLPSGSIDSGLNVSIDSFYSVGSQYNIEIDPANYYIHMSSLSSFYTDPYTRELLYTNGVYIHAAGFNFSVFNSDFLQPVNAIYPDFTYDLAYDVNHGFRYATFAFMYPSTLAPKPFQYINISVQNPSAVSTITGTRELNNFYPDNPVPSSMISLMKCRMHVKLIGVHNPSTYEPFETAWVNCMKQRDTAVFTDSIYDVGGSVAVSQLLNSVVYKTQINRRFYTNILALVRIGISQDGSVYGGLPLTFTGVTINLSDD